MTATIRTGPWRRASGWRFHVAIIDDDGEGFSVVALNLPGCGSCGETREQALANFKEAAQLTVESYNGYVPWTSDYQEPGGVECRWIFVDSGT